MPIKNGNRSHGISLSLCFRDAIHQTSGVVLVARIQTCTHARCEYLIPDSCVSHPAPDRMFQQYRLYNIRILLPFVMKPDGTREGTRAEPAGGILVA